MAARLYIDYRSNDYGIYSETPTAILISPRETAIVLSLFVRAKQRDLWEDMSDAEWDSLEGEIVEIIDRLQSAI